MEPPQKRQDLVADQAAPSIGIGRVDAEPEPVVTAVLLRLLAPERQQRPHDAVLAPHLDPSCVAAGDEPVENGLDLVGSRVARRAEPMPCGQPVPQLTQRRLSRALWL